MTSIASSIGGNANGTRMTPNGPRLVAAMALLVMAACGPRPDALTFSGSVLGAEGEIVRRQIARFAAANPDLWIEIRPTPDAADQRHQLYVQWLNAWAPDPDVLQLDVIWRSPDGRAARDRGHLGRRWTRRKVAQARQDRLRLAQTLDVFRHSLRAPR